MRIEHATEAEIRKLIDNLEAPAKEPYASNQREWAAGYLDLLLRERPDPDPKETP